MPALLLGGDIECRGGERGMPQIGLHHLDRRAGRQRMRAVRMAQPVRARLPQARRPGRVGVRQDRSRFGEEALQLARKLDRSGTP